MIDFVLFDVGGVVIFDLTTQSRWEEFKKDIGLKPKYSEEFDTFWDKIDPELNVDLPVDSIIPTLEKKFELDFPEGFSIQKYFVSKFKKNESIWPLIDQVRQKAKIGLLTNMYPGMLNEIKAAGILPSVNWNIEIDSSIVGCQKPDQRIYKVSEQLIKANPEEILFIDNSTKNIQGAKEANWNTFKYDQENVEESNKKLTELINSL